jgi:hypothetical protein
MAGFAFPRDPRAGHVFVSLNRDRPLQAEKTVAVGKNDTMRPTATLESE